MLLLLLLLLLLLVLLLALSLLVEPVEHLVEQEARGVLAVLLAVLVHALAALVQHRARKLDGQLGHRRLRLAVVRCSCVTRCSCLRRFFGAYFEMRLDQIVLDLVGGRGVVCGSGVGGGSCWRRRRRCVLHLRPQVAVDDVVVGMLGQVVADDGRLVREIARVVAQVAVDERRLVHGAIARQLVVEHRAAVCQHVAHRHAYATAAAAAAARH